MEDTGISERMMLKFIPEIYGACDGVARIECDDRDHCQLC